MCHVWRNLKDLCSTAGICSATTPFVLLGDVLDCLPLDLCDKIFSFVEENVSTWKSVNKFQLLSKAPHKFALRWSHVYQSCALFFSQNSFYTAGKNYLLRMCNGKELISSFCDIWSFLSLKCRAVYFPVCVDLLRRLSKSQNTVFCGRIQLFLARLFPLSEKSGKNSSILSL